MVARVENVNASTIDVNTLVDGQQVRAPAIILLALATLTLISDGFDISAIGYVGPELVKQWHIVPAQLVSVFSAGIIGLLCGAPAFGYVGDRFGRKRAILAGLCFFGSITLLTMAATSVAQLVVLRFLTGIGLGGLIPNVIALTAEAAPKRLRGMFVAFINFGVIAGFALPGFVSATLVPSYGWTSLMLVGGVLPLAIALLALFVLPESIKYLVQKGGRDDETRRLARILRPDLPIGLTTRFSTTIRPAGASSSPKQLFVAGLAGITPMLWLALAANQMANFFVLSWLPTLLQSAGSSTVEAGVAASMYAIGGLFGGLAITLIVDKLGVIPLVLLFVLSVPFVAGAGVAGADPWLFRLMIAGAGFCTTGINFGMNVAMGTIYPTQIRSVGAGWAQAVGRLGSLVSPALGGILLGMHLAMQELLFAPALILAIGAAACVILALLCVRRFGGYRLEEFSAVEAGRLASARRLSEAGHSGEVSLE